MTSRTPRARGWQPVPPYRYAGSDRLFETIDANVTASDPLERLFEIDHSRLGAEAGSLMPPARVLIFSDPGLEAELLRIELLIAIDSQDDTVRVTGVGFQAHAREQGAGIAPIRLQLFRGPAPGADSALT